MNPSSTTSNSLDHDMNPSSTTFNSRDECARFSHERASTIHVEVPPLKERTTPEDPSSHTSVPPLRSQVRPQRSIIVTRSRASLSTAFLELASSTPRIHKAATKPIRRGSQRIPFKVYKLHPWLGKRLIFGVFIARSDSLKKQAIAARSPTYWCVRKNRVTV